MDAVENVFANEGKVRLLNRVNDTEFSRAGSKDLSGCHQPYKPVSLARH